MRGLAFKLLAAFILSIGVHFVVLKAPMNLGGQNNAEESVVPTRAEMSAVSAFEALDQKRVSEARIQAVSEEIASSIETVATPEIIIPVVKAKPKPKPVKKATKKTESKASSAKAKASNAAPVKKAAPKPSGPSKAQKNAAKASFGPQVAGAFSKRFRVPRNVKNVRATVVIRFKNGRLASVGLEKSSGNRKFDDAVISAAKNARYPKAPSNLASDVQYRIPVSI